MIKRIKKFLARHSVDMYFCYQRRLVYGRLIKSDKTCKGLKNEKFYLNCEYCPYYGGGE